MDTLCPNLYGDRKDRAYKRTHYRLVGIRSEGRDCEGKQAREMVDHANGRCFEIETMNLATLVQLPEAMKYAPATVV